MLVYCSYAVCFGSSRLSVLLNLYSTNFPDGFNEISFESRRLFKDHVYFTCTLTKDKWEDWIKKETFEVILNPVLNGQKGYSRYNSIPLTMKNFEIPYSVQIRKSNGDCILFLIKNTDSEEINLLVSCDYN